MNNFTPEELISKYPDKSKNVGLLNFHYSNHNYGAVLTAYALNKYINNLGYNAFNIDYFCPPYKLKDVSDFNEFRYKYLPMTYLCKRKSDFEKLNEVFSTFITGSDQVFRYNYFIDPDGRYYLNFVDNHNKKIGYSSSFGLNYFEGNKEAVSITKKLIKRFDYIYVREKSGIDICKNTFDVDAGWVLDPVFLFDSSEWEKMASDNKPDTEIVYYIINDELSRTAEKLKGYTNINIESCLKIQDWVSYIKNADFVVTNSFHCLCFCIIFNKQFVCISPLEKDERMRTLFDVFNIPDKFYVWGDEKFNLDEHRNNILDYNEINKILDEKRKESQEILINVLKSEKVYKSVPYNKQLNSLCKIKYLILYVLSFILYKLVIIKPLKYIVKDNIYLRYKSYYNSICKW